MEAKLDARAKPPEFDADFRDRLQSLLVWRRDVRRFKRYALPTGTIERLIGVACLSPSVGLSEPWRFVILEDQARRAAIRANFERCNQDALKQQEPDRLVAAGPADEPLRCDLRDAGGEKRNHRDRGEQGEVARAQDLTGVGGDDREKERRVRPTRVPQSARHARTVL